MAIRELTGCTSASAEGKIKLFAKALGEALYESTDYMLIELIADAFGHMARFSPVSQVEYLESELNRALEWLRLRNTSHHRFSSCVMLQQLAKNAPTIFFARITEFFDLIWSPIWDQKEKIRVVAGKALSACLAVLKERTYHLQWYCLVYEKFQDGFRNGSEEFVHGSLLVVTEALKFTGDFMIPRFKEVCKSIMALKDHKSSIVRSAITTLLPSLATLCPDAFARAHLDESVEFLLRCCRSPELRPQALIATGKLCRAVGPHLVSRIDELMIILREAFSGASSRKSSKNFTTSEISSEALHCISDMVQGLGAPFHGRVLALLEPMLQSGLTAQLIETLSTISTYMENQRPMVQMRLLQEATKVLGGDTEPYMIDPDYMYSWGRNGSRTTKKSLFSNVEETRYSDRLSGLTTPHGSASSLQYKGSQAVMRRSLSNINHQQQKLQQQSTRTSASTQSLVKPDTGATKLVASSVSSISKTISYMAGIRSPTTSSQQSNLQSGASRGLNSEVSSQSRERILLSLSTLGSLSIPPAKTLTIIQKSVLPFLTSSDEEVRKVAASTCAKMIAPFVVMPATRGPSAVAVEEIVTCLLEVVVSDVSPSVRLAVLKSLNGSFDKYLARTHHIEVLMMMLADEMFEIKMEALIVLGRLAMYNPADVQPPVRQLLLRLISEMQSSPDNKTIEEAALMLCTFLKFPSFQNMVRPFMKTLLATLPLRGDARATTAALEALGELAVVLRQDLLPYAEGDLLPLIISNMLDPSSYRKQEVAVKTLGQFVSATGLVVRPYLQYPQLLPKALDMLCKEVANRPYSVRVELLRTLGLLGALDPAKFNAINLHLQNCRKVQEQRDHIAEGENLFSSSKFSFGGIVGTTGTITSGTLLIKEATSNTGDGRKKVSVRDRADSNISIGDHGNEKERHNSIPTYDDLLKSDMLLLDGDSADSPAHFYMYEQSVMKALNEPPKSATVRPTPQNEEFYPKVAMTALIRIIKDKSLAVHHSTATQTIILIFSSLGYRCVPFLEQIVPYFLQV